MDINDVRYYCWCHYYLWSLAQPTDASQSAGCLESVVFFRIEIGVSIQFLEIANLSTCASVFTGFSTVCFHSPEAFWSQKLAQKPILSLQQTNARLTLSLRRNSSSSSSTHSLLRPPVRDWQLLLGGLQGLSAALTLVRFELKCSCCLQKQTCRTASLKLNKVACCVCSRAPRKGRRSWQEVAKDSQRGTHTETEKCTQEANHPTQAWPSWNQ
jgi:hypothetical protein